ncbi:MAG: hypothetical protein RLZZ546_1161 [Bacteroidota bacterium]
MKKQIKFLLLLLLISNIVKSQNCYNVIADLTGLDNSNYLSQLETASCELKNAFPTEFQSDFKVLDFGFYSLSEKMQGGFQAVWDNKVITEANIQSKYYLLFGRQLPDSKGQTKLWVKVKLPTTGNFECFNQSQYDLMEISISQKISYLNYQSDFYNSQIKGITYLKERILDMVECCQPNLRNFQASCTGCLNPSDLKSYYESKGYDAYDIKIYVNNLGNPILMEDLSNSDIKNFARNLYYKDGLLVSPYSEIESELLNLGLNNEAIGIITNNNSFCVDPTTTALRTSLNSEALDLLNNDFIVSGRVQSIVYHLWLNPDQSGNDLLFKKFLYAKNGSLAELSQALNPTNLGVQQPTQYNPQFTDIGQCDNSTSLYEVNKAADGKYYGYSLNQCQWHKKDIVEFIHPNPYPSNNSDRQYTIGTNGFTPSFQVKTKLQKEMDGPWVETSYIEYEPCELCYLYSIGSKKNTPDNTLIKDFYGTYESGWTHQKEKDILFNSFIYGKGQPVVWNTNSSISKDLRENESVKNNIIKIQNEIISWVKEKGNLNGLISSNKLRTATNPNPNFTAWNLPNLWPFQMFGGIQGRSVKIVKYKKISSVNCPTYYECEFVYTLYDNFGLNENEGIWLPGMPEQWVLQHYRNNYFVGGQAFYPVVQHQVEFQHSFKFCK